MNRNIIFISIALFTWGLGESAYYPLLSLYMQNLGANPIAIGAIVGGFSLVGSLSYLPGGYLADRFGRRPLIFAGWAIGTLATFLMALANRLEFFVPAFLFYGLTVFVMPPLNSYVTTARGKMSIGRAVTLISASYNMGAILGPLFGGKIADLYGFRLLFLISAGIYVISTIIISMIQPQPVDPPQKSDHQNRLMTNKKFISFLVILFLAIFAMYLPQPLAPNFLQNQRQLNLTQIGTLYSISAFGIVILNLALGQINARLGFLLGQVAVGIFSIILWLFTGMPWFILAFFLLGGFRAARSLSVAQVRALVPQSKMGIAYGMADTVNAIAMILAPLLAGAMYDRQPIWLFSVSLVFILISVVLTSISVLKTNSETASELM